MKRLLNDFNVSSHVLRHTFTTRAIESGMNPVVLKKILGHTDISTTLNIYTDVSNELEKKNLKLIQDYLEEVL